MIISDTDIHDYVIPRFLKYVAYETTSAYNAEETPSTPGQWELARALEQELRSLGISDVELTSHCYVIARIPPAPSCEKAAALGFLAHMDTSGETSGKNVKAIVENPYDGRRIDLGSFVLDPALDPDLAAQKGKGIIHTDGKTLLGADDKAGIAEIMGAAAWLLEHPEIPHGTLELIFTPDEETGKGLPEFPLEKIRSTACYTLDGGPLGELETECFTAYSASVAFQGRVIHPGTARGVLANAALMAAYFAALLPRTESPEATDGYYGFYCLSSLKGTHEKAELELIIRDFDHDKAKKRVSNLDTFAKAVEAQFPGGKVTVTSKLQYLNMKEKIDKRPEVLERLIQAAKNLGIPIHLKPIRGGTDGSRLTELGVPTPNIFTGGRNFHGPAEWASIPDMLAASKLVIELARLYSGAL
ncbi:MAG: peptidase T [Spirochaetaceae bacterium]|jgi:tripeptide aminopeptidase|nr:peptidase T [Spirochaetaceae bacterium]